MSLYNLFFSKDENRFLVEESTEVDEELGNYSLVDLKALGIKDEWSLLMDAEAVLRVPMSECLIFTILDDISDRLHERATQNKISADTSEAERLVINLKTGQTSCIFGAEDTICNPDCISVKIAESESHVALLKFMSKIARSEMKIFECIGLVTKALNNFS